jgi:hypothetical protein
LVRPRSSRKGVPEKMKQLQVVNYCSDSKDADNSANFQVVDVDTPVPRAGLPVCSLLFHSVK